MTLRREGYPAPLKYVIAQRALLHSECLLGAEVDIFFVEFLNT